MGDLKSTRLTPYLRGVEFEGVLLSFSYRFQRTSNPLVPPNHRLSVVSLEFVFKVSLFRFLSVRLWVVVSSPTLNPSLTDQVPIFLTQGRCI